MYAPCRFSPVPVMALVVAPMMVPVEVLLAAACGLYRLVLTLWLVAVSRVMDLASGQMVAPMALPPVGLASMVSCADPILMLVLVYPRPPRRWMPEATASSHQDQRHPWEGCMKGRAGTELLFRQTSLRGCHSRSR